VPRCLSHTVLPQTKVGREIYLYIYTHTSIHT
jgi:hypothetical protein